MDRANKAMRQRIGRMKTNLGLSEKRDELSSVSGIDQRNQKVIAAINTYRKNISGCIKTGLREETVEKRKKKCDEFALAADLVTDAKELELHQSTCLGKVLRHINAAMNQVMEERVRSEMNIEKRVLDGLTRYLDMDKALTKSKERLTHTTVDVEIARKALNSKQHDDGRQQELQEELDGHFSKMESLRDSTITDIFTVAAKEQDISLVFAAYMEEQLEYHRFALRTLENVLPEIRRDIANARPRPMFGVDLEEHLRHAGRPISVVLEKCCTILRATGMRERGVFRVNGNNTKIRRMKAAFDAGQMDEEHDAACMDPHSVCSVLKSYLRELPDPLLTNRLHGDWVAATKLEGEDRLLQVEHCLSQLPDAYFNNLTYLINFLCELLQYEKTTMMNAGNLAIVFGPNLVGNGNETDNVTGSKIVETLLLNEERFFGRSQYYHPHIPSQNNSNSYPGSTKDMHAITRVNSTPYGGRQSGRAQMPRQIFDTPSGGALTVDTHSSFRSSTKSLSNSPMDGSYSNPPSSYANSSFSRHSPQAVRRPRVTAPLPPPSSFDANTSTDTSSLDGNNSRPPYARPQMGIAAAQMGLAAASLAQHHASLNDVMEHLNSTLGNEGEAFHGRIRGRDDDGRESSHSYDSSFDSIDDVDDDDAMTRSLERPLRPPPPSLRPNVQHSKTRPVSYNMAVGVKNVGDGNMINFDTAEKSERMTYSSLGGIEPKSHPSVSVSSGPIHRSIVSIEGPTPPSRTTRPPLPTKPTNLEPVNINIVQEPPAVSQLVTSLPALPPKLPKETTKL